MQELSDKDFSSATSTGTVLVDFGAEWCGPCKAILPVVNKLATEYQGKVNFYSVDIDKSPDVAARSGVMSVPTLVIYRAGAQVERIVGAVSEKEIRKRLEPHIGG